MKNLSERIQVHAGEIKKQEELQAALAGVFTSQTLGSRERFAALAINVAIPAFEEFKKALRGIDRDAVIVDHLSRAPVQSIGISLSDRYIRSSAGKTITLVNPKGEISSQPHAKFYELSNNLEGISIRQKVVGDESPIVTMVKYSDITRIFLENELAGFFERAYPAPR